jgi:hypothetical protein
MYEITGDLQIFVDEFGSDCVFTVGSTGGTLSIKGIFDNAFYNPMIGEVNLESSQPRLTCIESQITDVAKNDTVKITDNFKGEIDYIVASIQPDGTGMAILELQAV